MRQDVKGPCGPVFRAIFRKKNRMAEELLPVVRLADPEANVLLDRNFCSGRIEGEDTTDKLVHIMKMYRLSPEDEPCSTRAWWALQHAAFVVKQDLFSLATYAQALEEENRGLRELLRARTT